MSSQCVSSNRFIAKRVVRSHHQHLFSASFTRKSTPKHHHFHSKLPATIAYPFVATLRMMKRLFLLQFLLLGCWTSGSDAFVQIQQPLTPLRASNRYRLHSPISPSLTGFEPSSYLSRTHLYLSSPIMESVSSLTRSLFNYNGSIPLSQAFGLNFVLFALFRKKLLKMLTNEGFVHAFALGTSLWTTLGWRGWTLCVTYLFLGSAVTKVKFAEKEKRGIAESRGGRRGPENVW